MIAECRSFLSAMCARLAARVRRLSATWVCAAVVVSGAMLSGCSAPLPAHYAAERPVLDPTRYFNGRLDAWGMFQDRTGQIGRAHV